MTNNKLTTIIPETYNGQRLDAVLAKLFPQYSRSQLSQWLKEGHVTVNQLTRKPKDKVQGGEHISLTLPDISDYDNEYTAQNIPLEIVFEDEELLVINKPAGLVVHPGAGNPDQTLVNALVYHEPSLQNLPRAGIIHRLDKDTTGLLIIAKSFESHAFLVKQMQDRKINRSYLALVHGHVIAGARIETYYGRHPRSRLKMAVLQQGKEAITEYKVRKQYQQQFTLLDVKLMTGRTHQIRVHMTHLHHPIVGDALYGGRARIPSKAPDTLKMQLHEFKRQALHAYHLELTHPKTQLSLSLTSPLPQDFQALLKELDAYAS